MFRCMEPVGFTRLIYFIFTIFSCPKPLNQGDTGLYLLMAVDYTFGISPYFSMGKSSLISSSVG